jgi:type IV pilus assembly protein PilM
LEANVPLSLEELYFDYEIIQQTEESADHYDVLIIAFPKTLVDSYLRVLKGARFIPTVLELEAQSIARSIIKDSSPRDAFVIIDMGATRTTFIIFAGGTITFTLTIEFGGKDMHSAIAEKMKVSLEEAERLKKEIGLNKKEKNGKVYEALLSSLRPLVNELERELGYYEQHFSHRHGASQKITRIYLCGGEANLIGLVPYLTLIFKTPVVVADPLINIKEAMISAIPPFSKNQSLTYTTAIGLALRTIQ